MTSSKLDSTANAPDPAVILYTGLWFPLGINNVGPLGRRLFEYNLRLEVERPDNYRSSTSPERRGNDLIWSFTLSINSGGVNYPCHVDFIWHGSGYLRTKTTILWDQDGNSVDSPSGDLLRKFGSAIDHFLAQTLIQCMLTHQENYARNILFGRGIAYALDDFEPSSIHVDRETKARIANMRRGGTWTAGTDEELAVGLRYLMFKTIVFAVLEGKILSEYNEDFAFNPEFRAPLPKNSVYRKGRYELAYNFSAAKDADKEAGGSRLSQRYRERRGTIALRASFPFDWNPDPQQGGDYLEPERSRSRLARNEGDTLATDQLVDFLICLNSGIQLSSLLSAEMSLIRKNMIKARQYLVGREDADEDIEDFVVFVEAKLPLLNEIIEFFDIDFRKHVDRLRDECELELRFLGENDKYVLDYYSTHESSLNTLKRITSGLHQEIVSLSDYIDTQLQQDAVRIAQEARLATVRSLDTQSTLAEFQRASILKGSRTKFLSALAVSAFISAQGVWTNVASALWNFLSLFQTYVLNPATGSTRQLATTPTTGWNIFVQVAGYLFVAYVVGRLILLIERGIPDIVQASVDLELVAPLAQLNGFLKTKSIKSYRKDGSRVKVVWSDKVEVNLSLEQVKADIRAPKNWFSLQYHKLRLRRYKRANPILRTVYRPCSYHLEYEVLPTQSRGDSGGSYQKASIFGISVTIDRNSEEVVDAYIYPSYLGLASVLGSIGDAETLREIRDVLDVDSVKEFKRHGPDIEEVIKKVSPNSS